MIYWMGMGNVNEIKMMKNKWYNELISPQAAKLTGRLNFNESSQLQLIKIFYRIVLQMTYIGGKTFCSNL